MQAVSTASVESAKAAVTLAIGLIGVMAFWLGLMRIVRDGGLMHTLARGLRPVMTRLFPDVPADHPAMSAMIMNMAANMLGLGNAATPFGIKAMIELDRLNPVPGVATNAMVLFLAINTSNVALAPLGVIGMRAALGSANAAGIWLPTSAGDVLFDRRRDRGDEAAATRSFRRSGLSGRAGGARAGRERAAERGGDRWTSAPPRRWAAPSPLAVIALLAAAFVLYLRNGSGRRRCAVARRRVELAAAGADRRRCCRTEWPSACRSTTP